MFLIKSEGDWKKYLSGLDYLYLGPLEHEGEPRRYPCKVSSDFLQEKNAFRHDFVYAEVVKPCPSCGQTYIQWPKS